MAKSSIHFENTDASFAKKHNSRKEEPTYLLEKQYWQGNDFEEKITTAELKNLYAEQCQIRRERHARGATPSLKDSQTEAVINLTSKHTLADVKKVAAEIEKRYGLTPVSYAIHRDEGHMESRHGKPYPVYNYHAHVVFFTMKDGISMKRRLNSKVFEECNTLTADLLGMERGESKTDRWQRVADRLGVEVEELKRHKDETPQQYIDRCAQIAESKGIEHFNIYDEIKPRKRLSAKEYRQTAKEKAVLTQKIEVKNQELQKLHQEQDLQVFKANLNHFLQEGEMSHDNYQHNDFSHDNYSHSEFKNAVDREPPKCVCVPRLSECSVASSGQQADLSLYVAQGEGLHRSEFRDSDAVQCLLSKTSFTTQSGAITTLKQLSQLKSEIRKAFIAEQTHTQEDYKQLNKAFEEIKKRFKARAQMTPADVVKSVNAWLDLAVESEQLQQEKADLTSEIEVKTAEIERLKTELQEKPKEVEVPRELTSEEIDNLPIVQALREQHEKDKQSVAQASRKADEYRKQLSEAKKEVVKTEQNVPAAELKEYRQAFDFIGKTLDVKPSEIAQVQITTTVAAVTKLKKENSALRHALWEIGKVVEFTGFKVEGVLDAVKSFAKTARDGLISIVEKCSGLSLLDQHFLRQHGKIEELAETAVKSVSGEQEEEREQEELSHSRSFHR